MRAIKNDQNHSFNIKIKRIRIYFNFTWTKLMITTSQVFIYFYWASRFVCGCWQWFRAERIHIDAALACRFFVVKRNFISPIFNWMKIYIDLDYFIYLKWALTHIRTTTKLNYNVFSAFEQNFISFELFLLHICFFFPFYFVQFQHFQAFFSGENFYWIRQPFNAFIHPSIHSWTLKGKPKRSQDWMAWNYHRTAKLSGQHLKTP